MGCEVYTCPGFYRCLESRVCLQPAHLCDGLFQCPLHDDELLCGLTCPPACLCLGHAYFCSKPFQVSDFPDLRFVDAADSGMRLDHVRDNSSMLVHLGLARCGIRTLNPALLLPNLRSLDLSGNAIAMVTAAHLAGLRALRELDLSHNPITHLFPQSPPLPTVLVLRLAGVAMATLGRGVAATLPNLRALNLSGAGLLSVGAEGLRGLSQLQDLDVRGCPLTHFPREIFQDLSSLRTVQADNYKLCCAATLPAHFNQRGCLAPNDEVSSCEALLKSDMYRVCLAVLAALSLAGNACSLLYRLTCVRASPLGFDVFVTHLCLADLLMGVYLASVGVADRVYLGTYLWEDVGWRASAGCKAAGFLALLSSEVSALIICLITLDRCLVIRFPLSMVRFTKTSALAACGALWLLGGALAAVPLLVPDWDFYGNTGICIPLPVTRREFAGQGYSFAIFIVLNSALFLLIASGQLFIYTAVRTNSISACSTSSSKTQDLTVARRLITVAMSDFLCWFPIGLLGVLAARGVRIPSEVNVALAVLALPLNSALNPFLYTLNLLLERRRRAWEERLKKVIYLSTVQSDVTGVSSIRK